MNTTTLERNTALSSYMTVTVLVYVHLVRPQEDQPDFPILQPVYVQPGIMHFCSLFSFCRAQIYMWNGLAHGTE